MDLRFCPSEGSSGLVVGLDECIDVAGELVNAGEAGAAEGLAGQDREPALDLIEPRGMRRGEMKMDVLVPLPPGIALRLVGIEIVEDEVDLAPGMHGEDGVHEIEELDPSAALIMARRHLAIGDVEGGKQG